jgi:hypothetical protein
MRVLFPVQRGGSVGLALVAALLWVAPLRLRGADATPPRPPDPTTALLMSQPQIDTTSPVEATAEFDPPVIRPGGTTTYRVTFNAMLDSVQWLDDIIAPAQLEMSPGARGQILVPGGTGLQPRATFNTRVRATAAGTFTLPRYLVYVYGKAVTVPVAQLEVVSDPAVAVPSPPQLRLEVDATNLFVGQKLAVRVVLPGTAQGIVQALSMVKLNGAGFMDDPNTVRQRVEPSPTPGGPPVFIYETTITPIQPGRVELSAQAFMVGNQFSGTVTISGHATIPGGLPQYTLVDSPPVTLHIRPVPHDNELPGFTGAMGEFELDPPVLATNRLRVGDPVTLTVKVHGDGNLARLVPPPPPTVPGWRVFAGPLDNTAPQIIQARGFINFSFTLIPATEETHATPVIPFSYFNPVKAAFVNLAIPPVAVTVQPAATPVDAVALAEAEAVLPETEKEPVLNGLATAPGRTMGGLVPYQQRRWFPLVQLVPALVFAGLWRWDQRRRYYAAHPEILLRRRARRALHREWSALRKAASLGDTPRFAVCAVNAMRVACAPHYPAEPRALVSSDVLPLLTDMNGSAVGAVRRIFAAADADRFATQPPEARDLLVLRPELDRVLAQLEEKLR